VEVVRGRVWEIHWVAGLGLVGRVVSSWFGGWVCPVGALAGCEGRFRNDPSWRGDAWCWRVGLSVVQMGMSSFPLNETWSWFPPRIETYLCC
jgi:hypothetical protein